MEEQSESGNWASRWRPRALEEFCGHDSIKAKVEGVFADKNKPGLIGITGFTGNGKTTLARIIANRLTKYPSNDIIERDMGTHGSKDDVKELRRLANFMPKGAFRIFILDEFHLVRSDAASVLLKLMEEPPKRTIFIWTTNEPEKILTTLIGRSFMIRLSEQEPSIIIPFMSKVCREEGFNFKDKELKKKVLLKVATLANGQPRAAINLLEELYKTVKGSGSLKTALQDAVKHLEEVSPDLAAVKFLLMIYLNKPEGALKAIWDFKGSDWKQYINAIIFLNSWLFQLKSGSSSFVYGSRKILSNQLREKGDIGKIPVAKVIAVQNYLVDALKEWGTFTLPPQTQVPARLAMIVLKVCKDD